MVKLKNKLILIGMFLIILSMTSQAADTVLNIDGVKITITNPKTTFDNIEVNGGIVHIPTPEPQYYLFGLIEKKLFDNIKIEIPKNKFNFNGIFTPKVFSCLDENYNKMLGECSSWKKEEIPLLLNNSYYIFSVDHLTAYIVGSGGDYDSLQQCLFYVNGTSDSCSIAVSDYQEIFGARTFLNSVTQYPTNALRVAYGFEESSGKVAIDSSGNKHNGTINFTGVWVPTLHTGLGLKFNGVNATVNTSQILYSTTDIDHTFSAWINISQLPSAGNYSVIATQGEPFLATSTSMYIDSSGNLNCIGSGGSYTTSTSTLSINKWYNVVCVFDYTNSQIYAYIDGKNPDDCGGCTVGTPNDDIFEIGGTRLKSTADTHYFNGTIDEVSVWNRTLTSTEIQQLAWGGQFNYVSTKTNNEPFIQIDTDRGNISLDFNGTYFLGAGENFGDGIGLAGNNQNITIKNAYFDSFANSLRISDGINIVLMNLTSMNARGNGFSFYNTYSNNITLQDSSSLYSGSTGIYTQNSPQNIHLLNVNSSNNAGMNLYFETGDNADIKNSFFSNSSNHCVISGVTNLIMINNTIKNCLNDEKAGLIFGGNNAWLENNTFENNNINLLVIGNNATIKSNIFNISYDNDFLGMGYGFNAMLDGANNSVFVNNTIANSYGNGLVLDKKNGEYNCNNINIIGNTFANTSGADPNDVYITSNAENTNIWLNNFYTTKPSDSGINTIYCVNNEGNFYNESINGINETDCGLVTISIPNGESYEDSINITWARQSSIYPINYQLYYSGNSGSSWNYITTTSSLNYNWSSSSADKGLNYIKIVPYDGHYNGTNINSTFYKNELDVFNLTVLYSSDKQRTFEFLIKNIDNEAHSISWILDTGEAVNITSTQTISLSSSETAFVYVDYNYTNAGNFEVRAYANTTTPTFDSDKINITI